MTSLKQLAKEDMLFIAGETDTFYQHTAGLAILDASAVPDFSFETFRERVIERIEQVPNFRWKLQEVPLNLDMPYWVEDENFDYKNHFKRIAVPSPGDREALSEVVAHLYSKHLDRSKPLWEVWFIEGLADGKYAMLQKSHHCMMDGEGASQLSEVLSDLEPNAAPRAVDAAITGARPGAVASNWQMYRNTSMHLAQIPRNLSRGLVGMMLPKLRRQMGLDESDEPEKPVVPATSINGEIGRERGFVFTSLSLEDVKEVKTAFGVSVNDVVLALVGSAMHNYMNTYSELPEDSLRASIIVSLRTDEDDSFSNRVTTTSVTLATDVDDLAARLRAINDESTQAKTQAKKGSLGVVEIIQLMPPLLVNAMARATPVEAAPGMMGANLIVSNVKSSAVPLYIAGARLEVVHPMSIITQGVGINITCVSYAGSVGVGVTIDPGLVPHPWSLVDGLGEALQAYLALARKAVAKRKPKAKAKAKVKPGAKRKRAAGKMPSKKKAVK